MLYGWVLLLNKQPLLCTSGLLVNHVWIVVSDAFVFLAFLIADLVDNDRQIECHKKLQKRMNKFFDWIKIIIVIFT